MPKYPENLIHFCRPVLEHYELKDEMGRMFVRSMLSVREIHDVKTLNSELRSNSQLSACILYGTSTVEKMT